MLSAAVLALAACTQNDWTDSSGLPEGKYPLVIEAGGLESVASRATVDGNWEGVTDVALQVGAEVKTYTVSASGANKENAMLSSTAPFYWTSRADITVTAWWPYNTADLSMPEVKVNADQSSLENFKSSDYIYAHSDAVEFENPTLEFTHRTARVTVTLVEGKGVTSLEGASVSLNGLDTEHENPASVTPYKVSDGFTYDALVAPQTIAQGAAFISVQLNGGTYSYLPDAAIELAAGSRYNYTVKVNAKGLELVGCTITDWTTMGNEEVDANADYSYNASTDTYTVFTAEGLYAWAEHVNAGNYSTNCILANDIVLSAVAEGESNWTPIHDYYHGTFDGQNHTISGIVIDKSESFEVFVGLFSRLDSDGTVKNLGLVDIDIIDGYTAGGIVGHNLGVVSSCYTIGNIEGDEEAGGIVGLNFGEITSCYTTANIQGDMHTGGIVGVNEDKIIACYSAGQIQGNHSVGGIAGVNFDEIMACYSTGNIKGESVPLPPMEDEHFIRDYCAGGVAGMNVGEIRACYTTGDIEGTYVGGISGVNQNPMIPEYDIRGWIRNCYWSGNCADGAWPEYPGEYQNMEKVDRGNTWETATASMNKALEAKNSEWRYVQGEDKTLPPTLQKNQ